MGSFSLDVGKKLEKFAAQVFQLAAILGGYGRQYLGAAPG
jgi:hypothetical protein